MKKLLMVFAVVFFGACSQTTVVSQAVKLPNKCGNYDLMYGTLKADGVLVTLENEEIQMTPIGMTEAEESRPLDIGANVGQKALVKGIYGGDNKLYRAEIIEIVDLHSIDVPALEAKCSAVNPEIQKPVE